MTFLWAITSAEYIQLLLVDSPFTHQIIELTVIGSSEPMQNLHSRFYSEIILNFILIIIIIILNYKIV